MMFAIHCTSTMNSNPQSQTVMSASFLLPQWHSINISYIMVLLKKYFHVGCTTILVEVLFRSKGYFDSDRVGSRGSFPGLFISSSGFFNRVIKPVNSVGNNTMKIPKFSERILWSLFRGKGTTPSL